MLENRQQVSTIQIPQYPSYPIHISKPKLHFPPNPQSPLASRLLSWTEQLSTPPPPSPLDTSMTFFQSTDTFKEYLNPPVSITLVLQD